MELFFPCHQILQYQRISLICMSACNYHPVLVWPGMMCEGLSKLSHTNYEGLSGYDAEAHLEPRDTSTELLYVLCRNEPLNLFTRSDNQRARDLATRTWGFHVHKIQPIRFLVYLKTFSQLHALHT